MATIAWLIPDLLEGSGGHRTILQHADYLQRQGHRCVLYLENQGSLSSNSLSEGIARLFGYRFSDVYTGWSAIQPADLVFATVWYSAKVVSQLGFPCQKAYFVQDYEAWFNPMGDGFLMAENSYRHHLYPITIGRWLPAMLQSHYGSQASYFDFCADLNVYHPLSTGPREKAICFIYQPDKPRRCAMLGIEALGIVKHQMPDVQIYLYGSRAKGHVWFEHQNLGLLDLSACNELYNRCQVGLCISASNPSRIPFEMMAAALPVVEIHRENTLYDFPEAAMLLCEQTPESIASGLISLLNNPQRATNMGQAGAQFMQQRPLEYGLEQFGESVAVLLAGKPPAPMPVTTMYHQAAHVCEAGNLIQQTAERQINPVFDQGRLAFLPPLPRKWARFVYHRLRRLLP